MRLVDNSNRSETEHCRSTNIGSIATSSRPAVSAGQRSSDVLIVGAGPAGLSLAVALGRSSFSVIVLEQHLKARERVGEVLPPAVVEPLSLMGIWEQFTKEGHLPSAGVSVWWGSEQRYDWDYIRLAYGCGWHLDRSRFERLLLDVARERGVAFHCGVKVVMVRCLTDNSWAIGARGPDGSVTSYNCKFLVNAAGRARTFRDVTGKRVGYDRLVGVAKYYFLPPNSPAWEPRLWVETTPGGWWYSAPLPNHRCIAVFLTDADYLAPHHTQDQFEEFLSIAPATRCRLTACTATPNIRVLPAESSRSRHFTAPAFLSLGDAAYSTDPARGHGILNALRQATASADVITDYLSGRVESLGSFEQRLDTEFSNYLAGVTTHYRTEMRWRESKFWSRRH
jgi:flavin-dependent dehydrogenase